MPAYLCQLGSTPDLSLAELAAVFPDVPKQALSKFVAKIELADDAAARQLLNVVGGVSKVFRFLQELPEDTDADTIMAAVVEILVARQPEQGKLTFNIAELGRDHLPSLSAADAKHALRQLGVTGHYREGNRYGLSAAVLLHHQIVEIAVINTDTTILLAETVAVQDIDQWTLRDREKPYADSKKGMLPPKVARMMVNLALGPRALQPNDALVYDPYCGTGTVLLEAATLGCRVAGSDLDAVAVAGTKQNIAWWQQATGQTVFSQVVVSDAAGIQPNQLPEPIHFLVTEPFLGKQTPNPAMLPNIFKGLSKQYWGAFRAWTRVLAPGAKIVIVFPKVEADGHVYHLESLIDKLADLGYTMTSESVLYRRPKATVQRQIHLFTYQPGEKATE